MRVQILATGQPHSGATLARPASEPAPAIYGRWRPRRVLGADSAGGLLLPEASATPSTLYAPRGVYLQPGLVAVSDTGNHRVMLWRGDPERDGQPCDVVLGQPDAHGERPAAGGPARGMRLPTGILVTEGRLVVADAWHNRLLVWNSIPAETGTPPDRVIGQDSLTAVEANRGRAPTGASLHWPFGIAIIDGRFHVADTGNRRVLVWRDGLPLDGQQADVVLGQPDSGSRAENRGVGVGPASFRWPHALAGTGSGGLLVADAGNHRVLRWRIHPEEDCPADGVLGHPDMSSDAEFPYVSQEGRLRFPYGLASGPGLALADTANNRVLVWNDVPDDLASAPEVVLAQRNRGAAGENRWERVAHDTLCWPYGLTRDGDRLAIADSGNNRVVLWQLQLQPEAS